MIKSLRISMMTMVMIVISTMCLLAGTIYDVGPGQPYTTIGAVPWYTLGPGDVVRIHYSATPYREIINISTRGTATDPIIIQGILGPNGEQPIIDGQNATISSNMKFAFPTGTPRRGLIVVGPQLGYTYGFKSGYIQISNLLIRNANKNYTFTDASGTTQTFLANAAGIFVERGEHITVKNCTITGNGNGFFAASAGDEATQSRDILFQHNYVYGNGNSGSFYEHNIYTEAIGTVFEYNHLGNTATGSLGSVLKDRSAGTVIRYNWIEASQDGRMIDLVDPQDGAAIEVPDPTFHQVFVYGNILYNGPQPQGVTGMIHYGGDDGIYQNYRKNTLYFYNNTVVIECDQSGTNGRYRTILFDVSTNNEVIDVRNNIIFVKSFTPGATPTELDLLNPYGTANFYSNWISPGWVLSNTSPGPFTGTATGTSNFFVDPTNNPGFVSLSTQDFRLAAGSSAIDKGVALSSVVFSNPAGQTYGITNQYVKHQGSQARTQAGSSPDFGAIEAGVSGCTYGISPATAFYTSPAFTGTLSVVAGSGCSWTATSNASWITLTSGTSGSGNGNINYSITANTGGARSGTITAAGQTFTITQSPSAGCNYSLATYNAAFTSASSTGSASVLAGTGCAWTATSNNSWITITSGSSGSGNGTVNYSVAANSGSTRTGTLTIAQQTYTISQSGAGCITVTTTSGFVNNTFTTQTGTFTAQFDAMPSASLTNDIISLSNGSQSGLTGFAVLVLFDTDGKIKARNGGAYPASTISYSGGVQYHFRVVTNIPAHTYSVYVTPNGGAEQTVGLNYAFRTEQNTVTQLNNWAASINSAGGTGTLDVCNFILGTGPTCSYVLSPLSASYTSAAASGTASVTVGAGCTWTATSNAAWLTITAGASGTGNGTVSYSVAANTGTARSGTLTIASQTLTVSQAASAGTGEIDYYINETSPTVTLQGGLGTGVIAAEGIGGSNAVKYAGLTTWDKTQRIHFATAKDISSIPAAGIIRLSIEMTPGTPVTNILVHFNDRYDIYVATPNIDNTTGYQTFDIALSSVRTAIGNTVNDIYFEAGNGFPSGVTLKIDEIKFFPTSAGGRSATTAADELVYTEFTSLGVYPNPADREVNVILPEPARTSVSLKVIDGMGRSMQEHTLPAGTTSKNISTKEMTSGMYFILLETSRGLVKHKMLVVHP